jgi:HD-GYP domain-containing protein (c-di-GMP phosphodiesterase class II)
LKKKALAHIQKQSGRHFEPQVVDLFLKFSKTTASHKKNGQPTAEQRLTPSRRSKMTINRDTSMSAASPD